MFLFIWAIDLTNTQTTALHISVTRRKMDKPAFSASCWSFFQLLQFSSTSLKSVDVHKRAQWRRLIFGPWLTFVASRTLNMSNCSFKNAKYAPYLCDNGSDLFHPVRIRHNLKFPKVRIKVKQTVHAVSLQAGLNLLADFPNLRMTIWNQKIFHCTLLCQCLFFSQIMLLFLLDLCHLLTLISTTGCRLRVAWKQTTWGWEQADKYVCPVSSDYFLNVDIKS